MRKERGEKEGSEDSIGPVTTLAQRKDCKESV